MRLALALAAHARWPVFYFDVKSAFYNGEIQEEVFVAQPKGYIVVGGKHLVYKLKKALYGLKQELKAWYSKSDQHFKMHGFSRSES